MNPKVAFATARNKPEEMNWTFLGTRDIIIAEITYPIVNPLFGKVMYFAGLNSKGNYWSILTESTHCEKISDF